MEMDYVNGQMAFYCYHTLLATLYHIYLMSFNFIQKHLENNIFTRKHIAIYIFIFVSVLLDIRLLVVCYKPGTCDSKFIVITTKPWESSNCKY